MIVLSNLSKDYGEQILFEEVSLQFNPGERYGIVGANGCGKSTLLRMIAGDEMVSGGEITMPKRATLGVLKQDHFQYEERRIIDVVMMGNQKLWAAMEEKEAILAKAEEHFDGDRYAEVEDIILQMDGYSLEARAGEILEGLGIATEQHTEPLSVLSGGFKLRVLLAQVLAADPDVLLLDEPTNHLDIVSIRWLEKFLETFPGCVLVVSHDHRFLDNVSTYIVDVDYETITLYKGNYEHFKTAKVEDRERREREIEKRQKEIEGHKAYIDRFKAKATKARQASSKQKLIDRIEIEELPQSSRRYPTFRFKQCRPTGKEVLRVEGITKSYDKKVLDGVDLVVARGERIAIIGPNGIGKSTLLKIAMGEVEADAGKVEWGYETHPGYFAQDHKADFDDQKQNVEAWLWEFCPGEPIGFVRGNLGAVLFSGDDVKKKLSSLSGGEAARLVFARQIVEQPNILVLDEPTNHLDLEAIEALVEGLKSFEGTLIFVSHDRWFVGELATRIVEITPDGINDFKGSYSEYLEGLGDDHLDSEVVLRQARKDRREDKKSKKRERTRDELKELNRKRQSLQKELDKVTKKLQKAETRINEINEQFCDPTFFERTDRKDVTKLEKEQKQLGEQTDELMARWEQLETELSELNDE